jgi:hypothetical protein
LGIKAPVIVDNTLYPQFEADTPDRGWVTNFTVH